MSRVYYMAPQPPFPIVDGPTITAAALADASPQPNVVLPANLLEPGMRLEFQAVGRYSSAATPGTCVVGVYLSASGASIASGQALCVSAAIAMVASQTNRTWRMEGNASVRGVGTACPIIGALELTNISSGATDMAPATAPTAVNFDTTVPLTVRLGLTPSLATGSWVCHYFGVRAVN